MVSSTATSNIKLGRDVVACDCRGKTDWEYAFTDSNVDLGRCKDCGLYYFSPMPSRDQRITEIHHGKMGDGESVNSAELQLEGEVSGGGRRNIC